MNKRVVLPAILAVSAVATPASAGDGWTGIYAGVEAGVLATDLNGSAPGVAFDITQIDGGTELTGGIAVGYTHELSDGFVFGLETDLLLADISEQTGAPDDGFAIASDMLWSVSGIVGMAASDSLMIYAKGGLSMLDADIDFAHAGGTASDDDWLTGLHAGAGLEYRFTETLSARAEYRYVNVEKASLSVFGTTASVNPDMHLGLIGLNLRF